jgi:non-ribosomal peptide synthetase component E (peptide arylation enzyme)
LNARRHAVHASCVKPERAVLETLADLLVSRPALSNRTALLFGDEAFTYAELESRSNQVANALIAQNIRSGDFVCQAVDSRP